MKSRTWLICLLVLGIAASVGAQGQLAEKGKALVESKKCAVCHKEGGKGKLMEKLTTEKNDAFLKESLVDPKKALGPKTIMPAYKFTDEEVQAVIAYLRSIAKP